MAYYKGKYREARRQWLDLAEEKARKRGYEFVRDNEEEAFHIPDNRAVRVRASMAQRPTIKLVVDEEMEAIDGAFGDLGDRILLVILLINSPGSYNPETDDFVPVQDTILTRGEHTIERADGTTQLTIDIEKAPFKRIISNWDWVFEK